MAVTDKNGANILTTSILKVPIDSPAANYVYARVRDIQYDSSASKHYIFVLSNAVVISAAHDVCEIIAAAGPNPMDEFTRDEGDLFYDNYDELKGLLGG